MRICLFTPSFLPDLGGMEIVLDELSREFQRLGHVPVVIAQRSRRNRQIPRLPYDVIYYPRPRSAVWFLQYVQHVLMREHRKHGFDIVHAHMAYPNGYIAWRLRKKLGVPVVITSHKGDIIPESRYRRRSVTCKRMCRALAQVDAATAVSGKLKEIIDELTNKTANSFFIPNGVRVPDDLPGDKPQVCSHIKEGEFLLTLGRLHHYKGLDVLLEAMGRLRSRTVEIPHLVIAGDGKEMEALQQQARDLDLAAHVVFAGAVYGSEKHWLLRNCRFLVQPSRAEGMPLTVLEAMAYGKCVVGTRISGIVQLITQHATGVLVEAEDSTALADAIGALLTSNHVRTMGIAAGQFARALAWPVIAGRYLDLYRQLLK